MFCYNIITSCDIYSTILRICEHKVPYKFQETEKTIEKIVARANRNKELQCNARNRH